MPGLLDCAARPGCNRLLRARGGNVSILFGLTLIPIIGLVGLGVDYGMAIADKTRLDYAADAAALAGVVTAKAYLAANPTQANPTGNAMAAGVAQAIKAFNVNAGKVPFGQVTLQTPTVARTAQTINSSVTYTATVQNNFGRIFRAPTTTFTNTVTASAGLPSYLDIYLMVDVSGSMGLPSTQDGMSRLAATNTDMWPDYQQGCQFACHFPGYDGWNQAAGRIQLRSDAVNNAVCKLIQKAAAPIVANQYRIGIYPFINQLATLADIATSSISTLKAQAQCGQAWPLAFTGLLDTGTTQLYAYNDPTTGTGSGGTHFETALPQMKAVVAAGAIGDGSTNTSRKPFVFLVTDGMQNGQHFYTMRSGKYAYPGNPATFRGYQDATWDGSQSSPMDPSQCDALKAIGATISILYIPYNIIRFVDNGGGIAWENGKVNGFSPILGNTLKTCASPNSYYVANSPDAITAALSDMFDAAVKVARLTR